METTQPRDSDPASTASSPALDPQAILEVALEAAGRAADYLRALDRDGLAREYKSSSHDIVTEHDRACEEIIVASLRGRLPGCRIVGEEGGVRAPHGEGDGAAGGAAPAPGSCTRTSADGTGVTFYVDPIDGTSNFAAGLPLFCVSIGAAVGEELVAGVIDAPILGTVFSAADGPAMIGGPAMIDGRPIAPRETLPAQDALVLSGFPGHRVVAEFPDFAARADAAMNRGFSAVRNLGTAALELAYVAAGWADATGLPTINAWDVAAGFHIVRRAGGSIRTWPGDGPVDAPDHERPAYVACTGTRRLERFDELMEEMQAVRDARRAGM